MRLRSFTLASVLPLEIVDLIIRESSSVSTLKAWSLVSLFSLSIAGPLINEHVLLATQEDTTRTLSRLVLDEDRSRNIITYLPRLFSFLSLRHVRTVTLLVEPDIFALEEMMLDSRGMCNYYRSDMLLHFAWEGQEEEMVLHRLKSRIAPTLVRLLRPGRFKDNRTITTLPGNPPLIMDSWMLQLYVTMVTVPYTDHVTIALAYSVVSQIQSFFAMRKANRAELSRRCASSNAGWSKEAVRRIAEVLERVKKTETKEVYELGMEEEMGEPVVADLLDYAMGLFAPLMNEVTAVFDRVNEQIEKDERASVRRLLPRSSSFSILVDRS